MLSVTTEHAFRALVHMARRPAGSSILCRELAGCAEIPVNYLSKVLLALRNAGYVEATRGQGGGYRLARAPERIKLIDVAELFEGIRSKPGCLLGEKDVCSDHNPCSAHERWREVRRLYLDYLESSTIADLVGVDRAPDGSSAGVGGTTGRTPGKRVRSGR